MRVLGVDPGLTRCGLGVVEGTRGGRLTMLGVGVVRTPVGDATPERLYALQQELEVWLERYQPDAIAVERVFARRDVGTIMGTAQASAVPMLAAAQRGLPLALHTPTEVKAAVTGNGRADKAQVTHMVVRVLRLDQAPKPADAADALALAICHVWRGGAADRLAGAVAGNRLQELVRAEERGHRAARSGRSASESTAGGTAGNRSTGQNAWQRAIAEHSRSTR
ncbi:crossover junction endodeoxyribonuclease RuvC [Arsenicicoccus piscis]|uniref:Crossover junction endodeoxyribonuclease RuvC n=1 Tax=Arsenicicoccus piscis TaxID=673954 RepID=A0ABQ6HNV4_9MICO|nr:crossover junction endodeoxyribonuclease RuvC [Arsenicicoccus piscis]MCH8628575.1 crossover junction endodeoxyribonuclease RuvC [Arsenicicoccus piscis]MCH8629209.1 crossover junction endodeoxyribonuclease RuvC [Arsenicicoccus piscis]GMA19837.1 crossover junction endodeoxyribonuclease RuvC [Arsenicicoccus piscis]